MTAETKPGKEKNLSQILHENYFRGLQLQKNRDTESSISLVRPVAGAPDMMLQQSP